MSNLPITPKHQHTGDPLQFSVTDLAPLHETVDPDALDALFEEQETGQVTFRYAGRIITVDATGNVDVRTIDNENEPT